MNKTFVCFMVGFLVVRLAFADSDAGPGDYLLGVDVNAVLNTEIQKLGVANFNSRDGSFLGMDSDFTLSFEPSGKVILGIYGVGVSGYEGTYRVDDSGDISISLNGFSAWPVMRMTSKNGIVRLYRRSLESKDAVESIWPFRLTKSKSKLEVRPMGRPFLKKFSSPVLPDNFEWKHQSLNFMIICEVSDQGDIVGSKAYVETANKTWGFVETDDWRVGAINSALEELQYWQFYPRSEEFKSYKSSERFRFTVSRQHGLSRWVIHNSLGVVFDSMPGW